MGLRYSARCCSCPLLATAAGSQAPWVDGYKSKVRLIGGHETRNGQMQTIAGIEIALPPKWKTYWRNPGDAGGVPPEFDWSKSENVAGVHVLFPAPKRLTDETGDSIGYKDHVVFPVMVEPKDAGLPLVLRLDIFYGVCFDICVPAEAKLELELPAVDAISGSGSEALPPALHAALAKVPAPGGNNTAPMLVDQSFVFDGEQPHAELTVDFGGGGSGADLFVEGPAGVHLPMAQRKADGGEGDGVQRYRIDLSRGRQGRSFRRDDHGHAGRWRWAAKRNEIERSVSARRCMSECICGCGTLSVYRRPGSGEAGNAGDAGNTQE